MKTQCVICLSLVKKPYFPEGLECKCTFPTHRSCWVQWTNCKGDIVCIYCRNAEPIVPLIREEERYPFFNYRAFAFLYLYFLLLFLTLFLYTL